MEAYSLLLIIQWLLPLWLLGWLVLPLSQQVFSCLPDAGLAAGRILALLLVSLAAFWGASLQILPLPLAPLLYVLLLFPACWLLWRCVRDKRYYDHWLSTLRVRRKALFISDIIFLLAFLSFVVLRLFRPEINEFEKPMDSAIIGSLSRSTFLPAENPWFAGLPFTNYYYFGHFVASLLKRLFAAPLPYAYNLIQPLFCALFLSTLWSFSAALCQSIARGVLAVVIVALCGNFEPLRQWLFPATGINRSEAFPFLDWWSTSRVIPNTINEYPLFTLALGDAHAHFFALPFASFFLSGCYVYYKSASGENTTRHHKGRERVWMSSILAMSLAAILMTNAWDFPVYALLAVTVAFLSPSRHSLPLRVFHALSIPFFAVVVALPLLLRFKSQIGGPRFELWSPPVGAFYLMWGGFLVLLCLSLVLQTRFDSQPIRENLSRMVRKRPELAAAMALLLFAPVWPPLLPGGLLLLTAAVAVSLVKHLRHSPWTSSNSALILCLIFAGMIALVLPFFFYLQGYFSGVLRHQDTVFKLGLQAWLLLGTGATCGLLQILPARNEQKADLLRPARVLLLIALGLLWLTPAACSFSVISTRVVSFDYPSEQQRWSLNGAGSHAPADQRGMLWLEANAPTSSFVIEAVGCDENGNFHAAYSQYGRVSALTGVPAYIGWPQHARFWGAPDEEVQQRMLEVETLFRGRPHSRLNTNTVLKFLRDSDRPTFVFSGSLENGDERLYRNATGKEVFRSGDTAIYRIGN